MSNPVDRCVCFDRTFSELKQVAKATGAKSIPALQCYVLFGRKCKMCHPYVNRMLKTGEVQFPVLKDNSDLK
jgi:NAD(P)H-nitrite reductase large subunit